MLKSIEHKITRLFHKGCQQYSLLADGDRILVALSGGKDSMELLRLMASQRKLFKPSIKVEAAHVVMDNIPYDSDVRYLNDFCLEQGIKLHVIHTSFDQSKDTRKTMCFLCSWNRRKALFNFAKEHDFNKIALGHHQDDILVTLLMNQVFEGSFQTMPPILKMEHYPISIIRPMCMVPESLIRDVSERLGLCRQKIPCPYETASRRKDISDIFHTLESLNPEVRYSLWNAMRNIHRDLLP